jgi:hypothetical protein
METRCIDCGDKLGHGSELCINCGSEFACFGFQGAGRSHMKWASDAEKRRFFQNQCALARKKGVSTQVALYAYRAKYGEDPATDVRATLTV